MHQILFRLRLRPRPRWGAYSTPPYHVAGFGGRFAAGRRGCAGEEEGKGEEGKWREGKGRGPKLLLDQGPSEPCYATAWRIDDLLIQRALLFPRLFVFTSVAFLFHISLSY